MDEIIKQSTELYYEIDDCITRLLKARLDKDANKENEAIYCMESLLVGTMQHISWMVNELKGNSKIQWQTGFPNIEGEYLVTEDNGNITVDYWCVLEHYQYWAQHRDDEIMAWCKLSDIEPYKEETI